MFVPMKNALAKLFGASGKSHADELQETLAATTEVPAVDPVDAMIPDYAIADYVGGGGAEQFKVVGRVLIDWFRAYCNLQPNERVLEVGSGIGRVAIPLTQYLTSGSYVGFDIVSHGIEWCQQKVTPRYPKFKFFVADIYNKCYHPEGKQIAAEYVFPFEDGSFDFVFLTSVYTHMLPKDLEHYTAEISRVLRPGGRCFCTVYSLSEEAMRHVTDGTSRMPFQPYPEGYWSDTPDNHEAAVAYPQDYLQQVFRERGLEITREIPGGWWQTEFAQDILIAYKRA
jgi:SAM-dependent methyltransferase